MVHAVMFVMLVFICVASVLFVQSLIDRDLMPAMTSFGVLLMLVGLMAMTVSPFIFLAVADMVNFVFGIGFGMCLAGLIAQMAMQLI